MFSPLLASLALPGLERAGHSVQPEAAPIELDLESRLAPRLDPAGELQLQSKCNMGPKCPMPKLTMAWMPGQKVGVCACASLVDKGPPEIEPKATRNPPRNAACGSQGRAPRHTRRVSATPVCVWLRALDARSGQPHMSTSAPSLLGAKCGTTALYQGIYKGVFREDPWAHGKWGQIQQLYAPQWRRRSETKAPPHSVRAHRSGRPHR